MKKLLLIFSLFLAACSSMEEGDIIEKRYEPANDFIYLMPIPHTTCTGGRNPVCSTWYSFIPIWMHDDEDFVLTLKHGEEEGEVYVTKDEYACLMEGQHFKINENCKRTDEHKKLDREVQ